MTPKEKAAAAKAQALAAGKTSKEAEAAAEKASKGTARRKGAWSHVFKGMEIFNDSSDVSARFLLRVPEGVRKELARLDPVQLADALGLTQSASLGNMHGFDADSRLVRVDSPHEVIRMHKADPNPNPNPNPYPNPNTHTNPNTNTNPNQVIRMHKDARLRTYEARRVHELAVVENELLVLDAKARFLELVCSGEIVLGRARQSDLYP